jgi:hypothetical protein
MFIPFLDFDNSDIDLVRCDIKNCMSDFKLSTGFIIESTNGFNVFFLDKLTFDDCIDICKHCRHVDLNFIKYAIHKYNFTLRIGKDKYFIEHINSKFNEHELSLAHYKFFNQFFNIDLLTGVQITDYNFDNLEELQIVVYMSKKYGYIEVD